MKKFKWITLAWIVVWGEPQLPKSVPCPNAQAVRDENEVTYVPLCLASEVKLVQKEFDKKDEAEKYKNALGILGVSNPTVKENKSVK